MSVYDTRKPVYTQQWASMVIQVHPPVDAAAADLLRFKARYQAVEASTSVPWFFIACIHWREASGSFAGILANGEKIIGTGRKTTLVPAGRGPFATWEESAVDELRRHGIAAITDWCVERFAYEAEAYNGWGYANHGVPSAYLWSMSSVYQGGKYVADGVWDAHALDAQVGVMPLLKRMMELDASISFAGKPAEPVPAAPVQPPHPPPATPPAATPVSQVTTIRGILSAIFTFLKWLLSGKGKS